MASDIKLNGNSVILEGSVGVGTASPVTPLHVHGGGEVHSSGGGAGFSFSDRQSSTFVGGPSNGERWSLYANGGTAHLWSGSDKLSITKDGNIGIGTRTPARNLHVHGTEIHSGGFGGFSFSDRGVSDFVDNPTNGERWVLYSVDGNARLWSGEDKLAFSNDAQLYLINRQKSPGSASLNLQNSTGSWHISGPRTFEPGNPLSIFWHDNSQFHGPFFSINTDGNVAIGNTSPRTKLTLADTAQRTQAMFGAHTSGISLTANMPNVGFNAYWRADDGGWRSMAEGWTGMINLNQNDGCFRIIAAQRADKADQDLVLKEQLTIQPNGDISVAGNLVAKTVTNTSSKTLKENIAVLSAQEAVAALTDLNPVKFNFKSDGEKELHVGFIAEDVPELVAMADRKTLSSMDIVAVLTKVVKEQQQAISQLTTEVQALKLQQA